MKEDTTGKLNNTLSVATGERSGAAQARYGQTATQPREACGVRGACSRFFRGRRPSKAPASWTHSMRFATSAALGKSQVFHSTTRQFCGYSWHVVCCQMIRMILSAEASEIIAYLKTANGKFVNLAEISRRAGGKRRFEDTPDWAKNLMSPLVDAGFLEVNSRGHYRVPVNGQDKAQPQAAAKPTPPPPPKQRGKVLGDNYFPTSEESQIVAGDYFPTSD